MQTLHEIRLVVKRGLAVGLIAYAGYATGHAFRSIPASPPPVAVSEPRTVLPLPRVETYEVTAYCPCSRCCGKWSDGFTANGHKIRPGDRFVAADSSIPFGTMLTVPGYGRVPVLDRGGAITGKRLDLFFPTHQEALNWGRQTVQVTF